MLALVSANAADEPKPFFLPKSPTAAAYVLGRLSNEELTAAPRSEFVYVALLQRNGLEIKYRTEALEGLVSLRNTSPLVELVRGLLELDKKGTNAEPTLRDLGAILLQSTPVDLATNRPALAKLAAESETALCRQFGSAAVMTADGSIELLWHELETDNARLADLILSVPLVRDERLRATAYPKIAPLLHSSSPEMRHAVMSVLPRWPGHETEMFKALAEATHLDADREFAVAGLVQLPRDLWPKERIEPLLAELIGYLNTVPVEKRTDPGPAGIFQFATDLCASLPSEKSQMASHTLRSLGVSIVTIRALKEQMLYDKSLIVAEIGKPIQIVFINEDAMPHNFVVLAPGKLQEIGEAAEQMTPVPDKEGRLYIPDSPAVLHGTRLVEPGHEARLAFNAPHTEGEYLFVCTFPGHWRRMTGILAAVKDVDAYLASHPLNPVKITMWKIEDFAPDFAQPLTGSNPAAGRELFTQLACRQCHKIAGDGTAYGPDLTEVFQRWKGDRVAVVQQILEPSKVIEDRYRVFSFELKDGEETSGMILEETPEGVRIQTGPSENLVQNIKKTEIKARKAHVSSVMPLGLLNTLSKQQIMDLLVYLQTCGKIEAHQHTH